MLDIIVGPFIAKQGACTCSHKVQLGVFAAYEHIENIYAFIFMNINLK